MAQLHKKFKSLHIAWKVVIIILLLITLGVVVYFYNQKTEFLSGRLSNLLSSESQLKRKLANVEKELCVIDFKTSNFLSEDVYLQTAGYWLLLDENLLDTEERPYQRIVLRLPKDGSGFEHRVVPTPLQFDTDTFLRLREIHRWNLLAERLNKQYENSKN